MRIYNKTYYDSDDILELLTLADLNASVSKVFVAFYKPEWTKRRGASPRSRSRVTSPKNNTAALRIGIVKREHLGIPALEQIAGATGEANLYIPTDIVIATLEAIRDYGIDRDIGSWISHSMIAEIAERQRVRIHPKVNHRAAAQSKSELLQTRLETALNERRYLERALQRIDRSKDSVLDRIDDVEARIRDIRLQIKS
jgi:hypothetical protein